MTIFGDNLRLKREAAGYTQEDFAQLIGESRENYNSVENGRRALTDEKIVRLIEIPKVDVTFEEVMRWKRTDMALKQVDKLGIQAIQEGIIAHYGTPQEAARHILENYSKEDGRVFLEIAKAIEKEQSKEGRK